MGNRCPLCKRPAEIKDSDDRDRFNVACKFCGDFEITSAGYSVASNCSDYYPLIGQWIREKNKQGVRPSISTQDLEPNNSN